MNDEPESLKMLSRMAKQAMNHHLAGKEHLALEADKATALKIYYDWKWALKKRLFTYKEIDDLLSATITETERRIQDPGIRGSVIAKFQQARVKISEFTVEEQGEQAAVCPKCSLPMLICPCLKV